MRRGGFPLLGMGMGFGMGPLFTGMMAGGLGYLFYKPGWIMAYAHGSASSA